MLRFEVFQLLTEYRLDNEMELRLSQDHLTLAMQISDVLAYYEVLPVKHSTFKECLEETRSAEAFVNFFQHGVPLRTYDIYKDLVGLRFRGLGL